MMTPIYKGMIFRHMVNGACITTYKVLLTATNSETKEPVVIYCEMAYDMEGPLYGDNIMVPLEQFRHMVKTWVN